MQIKFSQPHSGLSKSRARDGHFAVASATTPTNTSTFIAFNSTWRCLANGVDQGPAWIAPTFAYGAWSSSVGKLGFNTGNTGFGTAIQSAPLPQTGLVAGTNVIAAEVHQSSAVSSDLVFDLKLTGNASVAVRLKQAMLSNGLALYWDDSSYVLESAAAILGPWTPVPAASNPTLISPVENQRFFLLKR